MKNELSRYEKLYSMLSSSYHSLISDTQEVIPTIAEKTIRDNIVAMRINNQYALNLRALRNFVQT